MVCSTRDHERWKGVPAWWRDQPWLGATTTARYEEMLVWRNCRTCGSTLGRHVPREGFKMDAPDGYWVTAKGYAHLAAEQERGGHLDLAAYFYKRAAEAAVAQFEESCRARGTQLVPVDMVPEECERTEVMSTPSPWLEARP
jgi:hypothetical protein